MIYEMRTYDLHPGKLAEFEDGFGKAYQEHRSKLSKLAAFWHTEIGPLHQVIHVWPYPTIDERVRIRDEAARSGHWPPPNAALIARMHSDIMLPVPGASELPAGRHGPWFEICISTYRTAALGRLSAAAAGSIAWYSEIGSLNKLVQIFPLRSLDQRKGPPALPAELLISTESKVVVASSFSPLQ